MLPSEEEGKNEAKKKYYIDDVEKIVFEYDKQSDILYIHFADPSEDAEEALMTENEIIIRIKGERILSMTILDFSKKSGYQC